MSGQDFNTTPVVKKTPREAFAAINHVRGWWSEDIEGHTDRLGAEFVYRDETLHLCKLLIVERVPEIKVVWLVRDNHFYFTANPTEWKGMQIVFEITQSGQSTSIHFTHRDLIPAYECYGKCSLGWSDCIRGSLRNLIVMGQGQPSVRKAVSHRAYAQTQWRGRESSFAEHSRSL